MSIALANHFNTEIISCDSRQFYKEMYLGTAKPSPKELAAAPHHFVGHISIQQEYSAGHFARDARNVLNELYKKNDIVILSGGSGLFIRALCQGFDEFPSVPKSISENLNTIYESEGIESLRSMLSEKDPDYYKEVDINNPHRLLRALSVIEASGKTFSSFRNKSASNIGFTPIYIQMHHPRPVLYERINKRVHLMMAAGQLEESQSLYKNRQLKSLNTVGYKELFRHLDGEWTLDEAIEKIQQNSRNYAKRQITWMRGEGFWKHFRPDEKDEVMKYVKWIISNQLTIKTSFTDNQLIISFWNSQDHLMAKMTSSIRKKKIESSHLLIHSPLPYLEAFLVHETTLLAEEYGWS